MSTVWIVANLNNSMTNAQSMQYTITAEQGDEWVSVLNLLGLAELNKAERLPSCGSACVWAQNIETGHSTSGKSHSIKTSPEADTKGLASMELLCPWPSEPHSGCRGMCISSVPCESQIHFRCTSPVSLPPLQHPIPQIRCHFPALPWAWNVEQSGRLLQLSFYTLTCIKMLEFIYKKNPWRGHCNN